MKKSLVISLLISLHISSIAQVNYESFRLAGFIDKPAGNIQSIIEQKFNLINKKITDSLYLAPGNMILTNMYEQELAKDKLSLTNTHYDPKDTGKFYSRSIFSFDPQGNFIGSVSDYRGTLYSSCNKLKFDAKHQVIEIKSYSTSSWYKDSLIQRETKKYDPNGKLIDYTRYTDNKKMGLAIRYTYAYDKNGNLLSETSYVDPKSEEYLEAAPCDKGAQIYKTTDKGYLEKRIFEYENNRLVHSFRVRKNGCIHALYHKRMSYDEKGDKTKEFEYDIDGKITNQWSGKYIGHRLVLIQELHGYDPGAWPDSSRWNYDEQGNLIEKIKYSPNGVPYHIFKYTYDDHHNWITKMEIKNDEVLEFVRRRITYYDRIEDNR